jgi:hypothetical protein
VWELDQRQLLNTRAWLAESGGNKSDANLASPVLQVPAAQRPG